MNVRVLRPAGLRIDALINVGKEVKMDDKTKELKEAIERQKRYENIIAMSEERLTLDDW